MILFGLAWATMPLPAYDDVVVQRRWFKVNGLIEAACEPGPGGVAKYVFSSITTWPMSILAASAAC